MLRLEAEQRARAADVGEAVANVPRARLAQDLRPDVRSHGVRQQLGHLLHGVGAAAADIDHRAGDAGSFERGAEGAGDVAHMHEVAPLLAVLEDQRRLAVDDARGEVRQHAGIGVGERLSRAEHIEQPQRHGLDAIRLAEDQRRPLLRIFRQRIDRGQINGLLFIGRDRRQRGAVGAGDLPSPLPDGRGVAPRIADGASVRGAIEPLAVHAHR